MNDSVPLARLMVEKYRVDVNGTNDHGQTALHHAARHNSAAVASYLLAVGAVFDSFCCNDRLSTLEGKPTSYTPIEYARRFRSREVEQILLKAAAASRRLGTPMEDYEIFNEGL